MKEIVQHGDYLRIFGFLQYVIRHRKCPYRFAEGIDWALEKGRAAYRVIDNRTIAPISNDSEGVAVRKAFADLAAIEFGGERVLALLVAEMLTAGKDADSIRESIHAVESVARLLDPEASKALGPALKRLKSDGKVHPALKQGFDKIYGYTNDEQGIRHPILDAVGNVDSIDAQFMFGACASFVSYLIAKARKAKIDIK